MNTVNILETVFDRIQQLFAFPDDTEGNIKAQALFGELLRKTYSEFTQVDINYYAERGEYKDNSYQLNLIHST